MTHWVEELCRLTLLAGRLATHTKRLALVGTLVTMAERLARLQERSGDALGLAATRAELMRWRRYERRLQQVVTILNARVYVARETMTESARAFDELPTPVKSEIANRSHQQENENHE